MRQIIGILCVVISIACGKSAFADELAMRQAIFDQSLTLYKARDFAALEAMIEKFRSGRERTESGSLKMSLVYNALADGPIERVENRTDAVLRKNQKIVDAWLAKYPDSPVARVLNAKMMLQWGWLARGYGWAKDVTPQGWQTLRRRGEQAQRYLMKKGQAGVKDAEWFDTMLVAAVAQGASRDVWYEILDASLKFEPEALVPIMTMINFSQAKWGGAEFEAKDIVERVVAANRPEDQAEMYARAYWVVHQMREERRPSVFAKYDANWPKMREGFEAIIKKYPSSWNLNNYALFACMAKDFQTAKRLVPLIGENIEVEVWYENNYSCVVPYHAKVDAAVAAAAAAKAKTEQKKK